MTHQLGTAGRPWGAAERAQWRSLQPIKRRYATDVVPVVDRLRARFDVEQYGELDDDPDRYPLFAIRARGGRADLPIALVTGGVHGYETSGVHGALQFVEEHGEDHVGRLDLLVLPCVSPWGYERIQRWNALAIDPNRSFRGAGECAEAAAVIRLLAPVRDRVLVHIDLHETTDSDETEFRPALSARDGQAHEPGIIPDGFYVVGDTANPQAEFQRAIIDAVAQVTHIAPADADGQLIGSRVVAPGVICYPFGPLGLCAGVTPARFTSTTEVYPDSPRATPAQCNAAQVAAVRAAIDFALAHR